jgi:hypothetical protein
MAPPDPPPTQIDHAELKKAAQDFVDEDARLSSEVYFLMGKISGLGDIYGDDTSGRQVNQGFLQAQDNISKYVGSLCGAYATTGVGLGLMESNVKVANWNTAATLPVIDAKSVPRIGS